MSKKNKLRLACIIAVVLLSGTVSVLAIIGIAHFIGALEFSVRMFIVSAIVTVIALVAIMKRRRENHDSK